MKLLLLFCLFSFSASSQSTSFPQSWLGNWKGELLWYAGAGKEPKKVAMELKIQPADSTHKFSWQLIYGAGAEDNRPYTLIAKDTAKGHWVIDEHNGIVLDQYWIANKFCGAFTVQSSTIINNYWLEDGKLHVEFYSLSAKPIATTGKGNTDSPFVDSYRVKSYQKAVLAKRSKE
jgi:hypothetical protein